MIGHRLPLFPIPGRLLAPPERRDLRDRRMRLPQVVLWQPHACPARLRDLPHRWWVVVVHLARKAWPLLDEVVRLVQSVSELAQSSRTGVRLERVELYPMTLRVLVREQSSNARSC